jgi:hypothetical protein
MSSSNSHFEVVQGLTNKSRFRLCIPACVLALISVGIASPSFARSSFDGDWSVVIQTRGGACPATIRYPVAITNGVVTNAGDAPVSVRGRVAPNGGVRVMVQSGGAWANGSGRLTTTGGSGIWRGQSTSGVCEGTWQAQRHSYGAHAMERGAPVYNYAPRYNYPR